MDFLIFPRVSRLEMKRDKKNENNDLKKNALVSDQISQQIGYNLSNFYLFFHNILPVYLTNMNVI